MAPQNVPPKVLVIGLDGGRLDVFRRFADQGHMPFLRSVLAEGTSGILKSTIPPSHIGRYDIEPDNTVQSELVEEARVTYIGEGDLTDATNRVGLGGLMHRALVWLWPF